MLSEVLCKLVLVQVRLQAENFLCNLLVLSFDALQLSLTLVEVQALCLELDVCNRMTLAKSSWLWHIDWSLLAS